MSMSRRSVPITFHPSAAYWRASSLPRPRPLPVISAVGMSAELADAGHQATDAARVLAVLLAVGAREVGFLLGDLLPDGDVGAAQDERGKQRGQEKRIAGKRGEQREENRVAAVAVQAV